jgi:amino acid transporter
MILIAVFILFIVLGSFFFPAFLQRFLSGGDLMYGTLIGAAVVVAVAVNWRFKGYEDLPELARPYATPKNRRLSLILYWGVMLGFLVVAWLVLGLRKMHS